MRPACGFDSRLSARRIVGCRETGRNGLRRAQRRRTPVRPVPSPDPGPPSGQRSPLLINTRRYGDMATCIALMGEFDSGSADTLDAAIRDAEQSDVGRIVVDLSGVSFIDSTALSALLRAKKRSDGRLRYIPSTHNSVTRLLQVTGTLAMVD